MNKKIIIGSTIVASLAIIICLLITNKQEQLEKTTKQEQYEKIKATILTINDDNIVVQDDKNIIYTFNGKNINEQVGTDIIIEYTGLTEENNNKVGKIINYEIAPTATTEDGISESWLDKGIFSDYYILANNKLKQLSLEEKIGQILLVRYPNNNQKEELNKYQFGGYIFFEKDFKNKTKDEVKNMIKELQETSKIPIITAVDEEGGKVVRISSNPNLAPEKFKSPKELYDLGGFNLIKQDTIEKSNLLNELGINVNLAPVVDISTDSNDYIYERTIGENEKITSEYAKTVIEASKNTKVSYVLKHFPGYGNNKDTHTGSSIDERTYDEILNNDIKPFEAGIKSNAEAILVSHNIVNSIDNNNPASLSPNVHNLLRNNLNFTGIIITDDLDMSAVSNMDDSIIKAITAGNDLIITTDYKKSIDVIKTAIENKTISEEQINKLAFRVIAWKYYKGLILENQK